METRTFGIDFGTSNSAVAMLAPSGEVSLADLFGRPSSPTVLFFPAYDKADYAGAEAIQQYLTRGLEGRFIQSMKAFLPVASFRGTEIRGRFVSIEELVARYLRWIVTRAGESLATLVEGRVVLGRPARYSHDPEADALAESRLRKGAELAGLGSVELVIEPVAAALSYESELTSDETVFVVDLGGGTSDFTVMRVGPGQRGASDRRRSILASGGTPVAGDAIDGEIVRDRLFHQLGHKSTYLALTDPVEVPAWIFQRLLRWNHVSLLKNKKNLEFFRLVEQTSSRPGAIGAFRTIVEDDLGYALFRAVERAKISAESGSAIIEDDEYGLPVRATLSGADVERSSGEICETIEASARDVLSAAEILPAQVDAVFMTGGTSLLPAVRARFVRLFGHDKLRQRGTFTSVADGLARAPEHA
ncbi:MAG: Hsp70 family protein [Deltaproteobacteria bacterium]|nr:Hsp70 family protein [Deltaproteobacteria bacterium]